MPYLVVIGPRGQGKTTFCDFLQRPYCTPYEAFAMRAYRALEKYGYQSVHECLANREHHQDEWTALMQAYTAKDAGQLGYDVFARCRVYCGAQSPTELAALRQRYGSDLHVVWISAGDRMPTTSTDGLSVEHADTVLTNAGTLENFQAQVHAFAESINV